MIQLVPIDIRDCPYAVLMGKDIPIAENLQQYAPAKQYVLIYDQVLEQVNEGAILSRIRTAAETIGTVMSFPVPSGEASKSLMQYGALCEEILRRRITRETVVLALGGGVVGDLAGFVAASLLRGVDFVQLPTTLLAQVDSSVGGKVGINAEAGKNLIGAFHQPKLVIADQGYMHSLPRRVFLAGMAEVIKAGLLADAGFLNWLEVQHQAIIARDSATCTQMVEWSVKIKAGVVSEDETERSGRRALLNLGHTFGHGLEALMGYDQHRLMHGEAVSIGTVIAAQLSARLGMIAENDAERVAAVFALYDLPTSAHSLGNQITPHALWTAMQYDKKNMGDGLKLVLLENLGSAVVSPTPEASIVQETIAYNLRCNSA